MFLIGLSGKKQSGKNTIAEMIVNYCDNYNVIQLAFADALKEEVAKACGVTVDFINKNKEIFRPILQWWGTEFRRKLYGDDYWIKQMLVKINNLPETCNAVIITDVRFLNEYDMVKNLGGEVWRVWRGTDTIDNHASECNLDHAIFDTVIDNRFSLDDLKQTVKTLIKQYVHQHIHTAKQYKSR